MLTSAFSHLHWVKKLGQFGILFVILGLGLASPATSAERVNLKLGFFEQSVSIEELKKYAKTGELSSNLQPYRFVFNAEVQKALQKKLHIDSFLAQQFLKDLLYLPDGKKLIKELSFILSDSSDEQIIKSLFLTIHKSDNISFLTFLEAYPEEKITIDLSAIAKIAAQINLSYLQNKLLSPRLTHDLKIASSQSLPQNFSPASEGVEKVYKDSRMFFDQERNRRIVTDIYYSFNPRGPLVVMSHGFAADRRFLSYLADHLASHGLTVVSVEHPGSNINALIDVSSQAKISQILPASEFINRPKDISFILNELEKMNRETVYYKGIFNTQKVSIIGHSFGGYTALALAGGVLNPKELRKFCQNSNPLERSPADWLQCAAAELPYGNIYLKDRRIVQAIAFNPIIGHLFAQDLSTVNIPTMILTSTEDGITPIVPHQLQPFQRIKGKKYLVVAAGATHMSVTDISYLNSAMGQSTLVREIMDKKADPVREMARGLSLAFIQQMSEQADIYKPYLSATYVQSLSSKEINLRLTDQLPDSIVTWLKVLHKDYPKSASISTYSEHSLLNQLHNNWIHFKSFVEPTEAYTGHLEPIFTDLLKHYRQKTNQFG
ncbi:dienelactone hydrolase [Aphanothece hegewaldii CCALA 016]|uniref:Dienelactone hydrolase n=1 Tax=Aphanothece hegewaldii CCALA 016 TaxID=2107694 RepID=A0A2T1LXI2_9CHRO|nr:alpha/beta hydrolase [Aphanothece hegewaldii]PSF37083.1 dienelactone hydrolase [Aphanothece hegewaldii CCALA 016]